MGDLRGACDDDAHRGLRPGGAAGVGSHDDPRPVPVTRVVLYTAPGCHLCEAARRVLDSVLAEGYDEVDISRDDGLEARYRELIPVVEIGGRQAFTYFVQPDALRRKLAQAAAEEGTS